MQPILAESAPNGRRIVALAAALLVTAIVAISVRHAPHPRSHRHHHASIAPIGRCSVGYYYIQR
jgi:hypothetical protein